MKLFVVLLGCTPEGRNTEQHDVFWGVGASLSELAPQMEAFWPGVQLHIDAWSCVERVPGYAVEVTSDEPPPGQPSLFFINLGGYVSGKFEEYHEKSWVAAASMSEAITKMRSTDFFVRGQALDEAGRSHVDDKAPVATMVFEDDETFDVATKIRPWNIRLTPSDEPPSDMHIGYRKWSTL